jgi:hypothetical protein
MAKVDIPGYRVYLARKPARSGKTLPVSELPTGPDLDRSSFVDIPADDALIDPAYRTPYVIFMRGDREIARFSMDQIAGYVDLSA